MLIGTDCVARSGPGVLHIHSFVHFLGKQRWKSQSACSQRNPSIRGVRPVNRNHWHDNYCKLHIQETRLGLEEGRPASGKRGRLIWDMKESSAFSHLRLTIAWKVRGLTLVIPRRIPEAYRGFLTCPRACSLKAAELQIPLHLCSPSHWIPREGLGFS